MPGMTSLADITPPIALGALDGRYRKAVAPLVDHRGTRNAVVEKQIDGHIQIRIGMQGDLVRGHVVAHLDRLEHR